MKNIFNVITIQNNYFFDVNLELNLKNGLTTNTLRRNLKNALTTNTLTRDLRNALTTNANGENI
jgi:hypothetical protein